ncbi:M20 family metallopeptidase [Planctomycetota bacterium]
MSEQGGARTMITEGVLDGVGMVLGGHLDGLYDAGVLVIKEGPVSASSDRFRLEVTGRGGHGGRPHEALDAVVTGSHVVTALQTIVSREVEPGRAAVVTVGSFHAGTAPNIVAGSACLEGTIRAQHPEVRAQLHESLRRIARSVGETHGAQVAVQIEEGAPAVVNSAAMVAIARKAAQEILGCDGIEPMRTVNMGGEDFGYYLERVRGCYVRIGGRVTTGGQAPAHSSRFDFDERALVVGAAWLARVAVVAGEGLANGT